jgi:ubiquinone/menaquinone biosynthesis C-methylase UbiE
MRTGQNSEQILVRTSAVEHHDVEVNRFVTWYEEMGKGRFTNAFAYGRTKIDRLLDRCFKELRTGAPVLDVGCGTGEYIRRANELGFCASGIEPADAMRKVAIEKNPNTTIANAVATALPFPDKTFDLVICIEVLRYLHPVDNKLALREMHRVLAPGGILFLTSVNRYALDGFFFYYCVRRFFAGRASPELPHCEFTTPSTIDREIRAAGFSAAEHHGVLFAPMRILYKLATARLASKIAAAVEPLDDAICARPGMRPFAGHLATIATT